MYKKPSELSRTKITISKNQQPVSAAKW